VVSAVAQSVGSNYSDSFRLKGTESTDAISLLKRSAPRAAGDTDRVVIAARRGKVTDAAVRAKAEQTFARLAALPHVAAVLSPFSPGAERQVSRNGRIAYATLNFDKQASEVPPEATKPAGPVEAMQGPPRPLPRKHLLPVEVADLRATA